jgi:putative DNA primase/helicase
MSLTTPLQIAESILAHGWNPVPIHYKAKNPIGNGWQKLIITKDNVAAHFNGARMNVGVQLGRNSKGLADIDLDCPEAVTLAPRYLPHTYSCFGRASKPRSHFLYYIDDAPDNGTIPIKDIDGKKTIIELRIGGGKKGAQTVFPGSTHESGELIEWVSDKEPARSTFAKLKTAISKIAVGVILMRAWPQRSGHFASLALGGFLSRAGWSIEEIEKLVDLVVRDDKMRDESVRTERNAAEAYARGEKALGLPGLRENFGDVPANAIAKILDYDADAQLSTDELYELVYGDTDSLKQPAGETNSFKQPPDETETTPDDDEVSETAPAFSEESLALVFTKLHVGTLRYVAVWGKWLIFDGSKWDFDETLKTYSMARILCRAAANKINKPSHAKATASAKTRNAVVTLACSDPRHAATVEQWDADPWLLNTPGGVIDLRNGKRRAHRATDYMTKMTAVTPDAKCPIPIWLGFLTTVTDKDIELQQFLQRVSGYALTGSTREHTLSFLYGTGANGKGVFVNTVAGILHDYHKTAPLETFTVTSNERHPTELAMLRGARLVTISETESGKRWAESRIKTLTGGDPITARFMRQDFFEYMPQFKLMISGNHRPGLNSVNEAIRRRVNMVPFNITIAKEARDKNLTEKLKAEWPGILAWMIEGCLQWQKIGMQPPKVVTDATDDYLDSEDKLGRWIDECLERDPNGWMSSTDLFYSWKHWAEDNNEWVGGQTKLSIDLKEAGFKPVRKPHANGFAGLRLKPFAGPVSCRVVGAKGQCRLAGACEATGVCQYAESQNLSH